MAAPGDLQGGGGCPHEAAAHGDLPDAPPREAAACEQRPLAYYCGLIEAQQGAAQVLLSPADAAGLVACARALEEAWRGEEQLSDGLRGRLLEAKEVNMELVACKQALSDEIMELSKVLFEEANGMVAAELRERAHQEAKIRGLQRQLAVTGERLAAEQMQLAELRARLVRPARGGRRASALRTPRGEDDGCREDGCREDGCREDGCREDDSCRENDGCREEGDKSRKDEQPRKDDDCREAVDGTTVEKGCLRADGGGVESVNVPGEAASLLGALHLTYFEDLLPCYRVDTRTKCNGASGSVWTAINGSLSEDALAAFSRFVQQCTGGTGGTAGAGGRPPPSEQREGLFAIPYLRAIYESDVVPALRFDFKPKAYVKRLAKAMLCNTFAIERLPRTPPPHLEAGGGGAPPPSSRASLLAEEANERLRGIMSHLTRSLSTLGKASPPLSLAAADASASSSPSSPLASPLAPEAAEGAAGRRAFCALCGRHMQRRSEAPLHGAGRGLEGEGEAYRVRLEDSHAWSAIDADCRLRLVAAGHFFTFIRHMHGGLFVHRPTIDLYYDMLHLRRNLFYVRLGGGAATAFFLQSDYEQFHDQFHDQFQEQFHKQLLGRTAALPLQGATRRALAGDADGP